MRPAGRFQVLIRGAELALPAVLALGAAAVLAKALIALPFHWELTIGESENVYWSNLFAHSGSLYLHDGQPPLVFPGYPPGFDVAAAPFNWIADGDPWAGRLVSLLSVGFAAVAAWLMAARIGCEVRERLSSAIAFLLLPGALVVIVARPDGLALGLTAALLLAMTIWEDSGRRSALAASVAAGAALVLTKQNFAPMILAVLIPLWLRDRRLAGIYAAATAALVLLGVGITELLSSGAFLANMRDFSDIGYALNDLVNLIRGLTLPFPNPIFVVGGIEAALMLRDWRRARAVAWAWPAAFVVLLTAAKVGSSDNYAVALTFASSILVGPALARLLRAGGTEIAAAGAAALALMLLPAAIHTADGVSGWASDLSDQSAVSDRAVARIERAGGRLLADRADLAVASGRRPSFDAFNSMLLFRNGALDPSGLAAKVRRREYGVIQSSTDLSAGAQVWPEPVAAAVRAAYCPLWSSLETAEGAGGPAVYIYVPCAQRGRGA